MRQYLLADGRKATAPQQSAQGLYDKRAFAILRESIAMGCLPAFKQNTLGLINLKGVPPVVAEVYFLDVLSGLVEGDRRYEVK